MPIGVPQDAHRDARVNIERGQERPASTASVVNPDTADPGLSAAGIEAAVDRSRLDRVASTSGEHRPVIRPGAGLFRQPGAHAVLGLTLGLER
jgi:hypothetical protein